VEEHAIVILSRDQRSIFPAGKLTFSTIAV